MKKFFKSPWTLGIGTTVIGGVILSIILDLIKDVSILSTMKSFFVFIWNAIVSFLTFEIKVWWLLIAIAVIVAVLWVVAKCYDTKEDNNKSSFLSYTQDYLLGYSWEWTWEKNWEGKYGVENLHPVCTKCKTPLLPTSNFYNQSKCPRCNTILNYNSSIETEVLVLIYYNAKKGNFNKQ